MSKKSEEFFKVMLEFLPSTEDGFRNSIEINGEVFETIIIEDIFMPEILKLLSEDTNIELLKNIFDFFEEVCNSEDSHLINVFSITVLEILGNDRAILENANKYMGTRTKRLQIQADKDIGRSV